MRPNSVSREQGLCTFLQNLLLSTYPDFDSFHLRRLAESSRNQIATSNAAQVALITRPSATEYTRCLTHISNQAQQTWDPGRKVKIRES
jgi:hypothetical protein